MATDSNQVIIRWQVVRTLPILNPGSCEPFKAVVHGLALGLTALMALYNGAAWLRRRQTHLAANTAMYLSVAIWEQRHVAHHMAACAAYRARQAAAPPTMIADAVVISVVDPLAVTVSAEDSLRSAAA